MGKRYNSFNLFNGVELTLLVVAIKMRPKAASPINACEVLTNISTSLGNLAIFTWLPNVAVTAISELMGHNRAMLTALEVRGKMPRKAQGNKLSSSHTTTTYCKAGESSSD